MMQTLESRIAASLARNVDPAVAAFAERLAHEAGALGVLFYGSNLRTGSLDGVLDFYVLMPGVQVERIWPRVSYRECGQSGEILRAKIATMALETFTRACAGGSRDTTIWTRFVQPSALVWCRDDDARSQITQAIGEAAKTAAQIGVALGPDSGQADDYWRTLFRATYKAEFRVEKSGREDTILSVNRNHFDGLLPLALGAANVPYQRDGSILTPQMSEKERKRIRHWWKRRRRLGKPLNIARLAKASTTFDGAARYAAWKVERHTGVPVKLTPWRERHPMLAAPAVLFDVWRKRDRK